MCTVEVPERRGLGALLCLSIRTVADTLFDDGERVVSAVGEVVGDGAGSVDDAGDEPHSERLVGVDHAPRERDVERVALADDPGQADGSAPRAEQAEPDARLGERGVGRGDPEVAGEREFDAAAAGRAVDPGDDDRLALFEGGSDALSPPGERFGVVQRRDGIEVRPGTEPRPFAVEVDDGRVGVSDRAFQVVEIGRAERVAALGPRERDRPDVARVRGSDHVGRWTVLSKGLCLSRR